jgi:hypothetical protein
MHAGVADHVQHQSAAAVAPLTDRQQPLLIHFILPLKEDTVEVIAEEVTILRRPGPTTSAAAALLEH